MIADLLHDHRRIATTAVSLLLAASLACQADPPPPAAPSGSSGLDVDGGWFRVPIHPGPADPDGGGRGLWTAGAGYKASFHDGFVFFPVLGPAYPDNLPVAWRTESVTAGGFDLLARGATPTVWHDEWRCEYRYDGVIEAYDVRADGVEQSFVVARRPTARGDLVIAGRITTRLRAAAVTACHAPLLFCDGAGNAIARYGEAWAFDADGRRTAIETSADGERVLLTVPGAWLDGARFPLTVDPLLAPVVIDSRNTTSTETGHTPAVATDLEAKLLGQRSVLVAFTRQSSATDLDAFAVICETDFSDPRPLYAQEDSIFSYRNPSVAFVGGADRWALAWERVFHQDSRSVIEVYLHDRNNLIVNSGTTLSTSPGAGRSDRAPAIGGTANAPGLSGDRALLVYETDNTGVNTLGTRVFAVLVDAAARALGAQFQIGDPVTPEDPMDREAPCVNQDSVDRNDHWVVVYQERRTAVPDDWDVQAIKVRPDDTIARPYLELGEDFNATAPHSARPRVAGQGGHYLVTFLRVATAGLNLTDGREVAVQPFWWPTGGSPVPAAQRAVATATPTTGDFPFSHPNVAFDTISTSHWTVVFQRESLEGLSIRRFVNVARLGSSGAIVEKHEPPPPDGARWQEPNVTYSASGARFLVVFASTEARRPIYGIGVVHFDRVGTQIYGIRCGSGIIGYSGTPYAGSRSLDVTLAAAPLDTEAILLLSLRRDLVPLDGIGMGGCVMNVGSDPLLSFAARTDETGAALLRVPLGDEPLVIGDVFFQWAYVDPASGRPLPVSATEGLEVRIRP